jgi:acetolactate synthase-1/2/3 large subunit
VTTYNLPVKILVLNNSGDGMVRQWQRLFFAERFCGSDKSLHKKDFIKTAEADGFEFAVRVSEKADVADVLRRFIEYPGPAFVEVVIDQNACVYPMIGTSYKEMVTGDFILRGLWQRRREQICSNGEEAAGQQGHNFRHVTRREQAPGSA